MNNSPAQKSSTCLCGCKQLVSAKANYRPGHDATHVSNLMMEVISSGDTSRSNRRAIARQLPSLALQMKLERAILNYTGKKTRTPKVEVWEHDDTTGAKVGRWVYPVQCKVVNGDRVAFRRNTKRDGSGEWVPVDLGDLVGL